jgi:hypothetical protein
MPLNGNLNEAYFISETISYYAGSTSSLPTYVNSPKSFSPNTVGYVMPLQTTNTCLSFIFVGTSPVAMTSIVSPFTSTTDVTKGHDDFEINQNGFTSTSVSNPLSNSFCMMQVTIVPPT